MVIAYSPFIQVRAVKGGSKKKVFMKGYTTIKNKPDLYDYLKLPNGKTRKFRSIFTEKCVEDMKKQFTNHRIFVDMSHELATYEGILRMLKKKGASKEEIEEAKEMLELKKLPIAKPVDLELDDTGMILSAETNPYYADYSEEYNKQYEATCGSILDGYMQGFSNNFEVCKVVTEEDDDGNVLDKIDEVHWFGTSITDNMALADNSFAEVSVRHMMGIRNQKGENMADEKKGIEEKEKELKLQEEDLKKREEALKKEPVKKKEPEDKVEAEVQKRMEEEKAKLEVETQAKEYKEKIEKLTKDMEELRTKDQPKSIVQQEDKFAYKQLDKNPLENKELWDGKLKEIASPHNLYMEDYRKGIHPSLCRGQFMGGWSEMLSLQASMMSHTVQKPGEDDRAYKARMSALERNPRDDMVIQRLDGETVKQP